MIEVLLFVAGIALVVWGAERFVEGVVGSTLALGVSTFALGVIFGGFDAENLGAGMAGAVKGLPGISLGTVIGSTIFLLGLAVGLTALLVPLEAKVPRKYIWLTLLSPLPLLALMLDGDLSRGEGSILFLLSLAIIAYIVKGSRDYSFMEEDEELEEVLEEREEKPPYYFPAILLLSLGVIVLGAELLTRGAEGIIEGLGISDTLLGMVFLAAAVSLEEVARMVMPARKGLAEISLGNVLGTVLFFVLFNIGLIAMIAPLEVHREVVTFHFPAMMVLLALTAGFMLRGRIARGEGLVLVFFYLVYLILNYFKEV